MSDVTQIDRDRRNQLLKLIDCMGDENEVYAIDKALSAHRIAAEKAERIAAIEKCADQVCYHCDPILRGLAEQIRGLGRRETDALETDIDKLALSIVQAQYPEMKPSYKGRRLTIARLGILEGMKLQRERDAVIAEKSSHFSRGMLKSNPDDVAWRVEVRTSEEIAAAIRSAL